MKGKVMSIDMKDSGIDWIGEIPKHWKTEKPKNMFALRKTKGNKDAILLAATQKYGMYPQNQLDGVVKVSIDTDLQSFKTVHKNDYVISLRSFQGGFEMSDYEGVCTPAYQVFYAKTPINYRYYKFLFKTEDFISKLNSFTIGIREGKNIQYDDFARLTSIPVPEVDEQSLVANFLDKKCAEIDGLIALQEQMIAQLTTYKQAVITETVTKGLDPNVKMKDSGVEWIGVIPEHWDCKRFWRVNYIRGRLGWKGLKAEEYQEEGYPFLSAFNIVRDKLDWSDINYISQKRYDESPEIKLSIGDLLIVKDGAGIGKCARVDSLPKGEATVNSSLAVITPSCSLSYKFEYYYLLSTPFQQVIWLLKIGMGVPHLTQENMRNIILVCPNLEEQEAIAQYLDKKCKEIDELISIKKEKIEQLKAYKTSVIYEYVTGKKQVN